MAAVKVLICGDPQGNFEALFKRVAAVNKSNGPFNFLVCVGAFFPPSGQDDADYQGELLSYITGEKKAPIPTYFIGGYGSGSKQALEALSVAPDTNLHYLGKSGVRSVDGLTVAFLDGTYNAAAWKAAATPGAAASEAAEVGEGAPAATRGGAGAGCRYFTEADVATLRRQIDLATGDIDLLLTNDWAEGVLAGLPEGSKPQGMASTAGSAVVAELALAARPRYHVAAGKGLFYTRPPYLNADLGAGGHVTRFISLAEVGNSAKQKWLHALGLVPAAEMTPEALQAVPEGTTQCPYQATGGRGGGGDRKRAAGEEGDGDLGSQTWRWQQQQKRQKAPMAAPSLGRPDVVKDRRRTAFVRNVPFRAPEEDIIDFFAQCGTVEDVVRRANAEGRLNTFCHVQFATVEGMERACQLTGSMFMGRELHIDAASSGDADRGRQLGKPVQGCWFCLSNPNADTQLVASIGEDCYLALDKGAISDHHVLVLPVEHYPSSLSLTPAAHEEMERYLSALRSCFAATGRQLVGFERYMALRKSGGNHAHVNAIAMPGALAGKARQVFERMAQRHGFDLQHLPPARGEAGREAVRKVVGDGEYFVALLPDGSRLVHPIAYGERFPLNYGREVLAELAGVPEKGDWKACKCSAEEEEARTERFKAGFQQYDIMS